MKCVVLRKCRASIAVRPHRFLHGGLRFLPAFRSEPRGGHASQHVPCGLEIVEVEPQDVGVHIRVDPRRCQLCDEDARVGQGSRPDAGNRRRRRKAAGCLLEQDDVA